MSSLQDNFGIYDLIGKNLALHVTHAKNFRRIFGVDLAKFFNNLTGFDVVKFDYEFIKPPDGTSTAQAVKAKFGQEGLDIVNNLIGYLEPTDEVEKEVEEILLNKLPPTKKERKHASK